MNWIIIAIIAYFLIAIQVILDKFLLSSKKVSHPAVYAFYSGVLSFFTLFIFLPFGVRLASPAELFFFITSGTIFTYGLLCLFFAIQKSAASQVIPVVGVVIPVATFGFTSIFSYEAMTWIQLSGIAALIIGGLLISFDLPLKINKKRFFRGFGQSVLAGILMAFSFSMFKGFYEQDNFAHVFAWTRVGLFVGAISLLIAPEWKKRIMGSFSGVRHNQHENSRTGMLFFVNKLVGGTGSWLMNYAIAIGSVTAVNALVATEYIFIFILGVIFSFWFPNIFKESDKFWDIAQKVGAIILIGVGIFIISR